jgi:hypothetical protein
MMTELFRKEEASFRIVGLPVDLLPDLENTVPNHGVKTNRSVKGARYNEINSVVVFFELLPDFDYSRLHFFLLNNQISKDSYGIWISLVTDRDNDGVHLPEHVLEFYKLIGGNIDFSFVCTGS